MTNQIEVRIDDLGGTHPTQANGVVIVEGVEYPFYFRYRYDRAEFYVWAPGHAHEFYDQTHELFYDEAVGISGNEFSGYMAEEDVVTFVHIWAVDFAQKLSH